MPGKFSTTSHRIWLGPARRRPTGCRPGQWESFDGFLLNLACEKGVNHLKTRVEEIRREAGLPVLKARKGSEKAYELVIGAVGVNSRALALFKTLGFGYKQPRTATTSILELLLGREKVNEYLGTAMIHVFLLDIPRLEFAAIIPKGEYATVCLLGNHIDRELVNRFMSSPEVRNCLPVDWEAAMTACQCLPRINVSREADIFSATG